MEETAISSAEVAEVTAKNKTIKIAAAPDWPSNAAAADGAGKPALTSLGRRTRMLGSSRSATAARPRVVENMNGIANLFPSHINKWEFIQGSSLPCETTKKIRLDARRRAGSDGPLPISLILEDSCDWGREFNSRTGTGSTSTLTVSNNVNHTEDQSVLRPHRDVTSVSVSGNRGFGRSGRQKLMHLSDASDLIARGVDGEDEDKDDREKHGSVGTVSRRS